MLVYTLLVADHVQSYTKIHILGDSFSGGLFATTGNSYREKLKVTMQALEPQLGSASYTSWAITGGKLVDQTSDLAGALGVVFNPDLLVLCMGQNDVTAAVANAAFQTAVQQTLDYALNVMFRPIFVNAIPHQPGWVGTIKTRATSFNTILSTEAAARSMPYMPSWTSCLNAAGLSQAGDVPLQATAADGYHPNNTGHQQLHNAIWTDMQPLLYVDYSGVLAG